VDDTLDRHALLGALLAWEGEIKRSRVLELSSISPSRASEWIREFGDQHPGWLRWDSKSKSFRATPAVYGANSEAARSQSLAQYLAAVGAHDPRRAHTIIVRAFRGFVAPDPKTFACLRTAIAARRQVSIVYRSMREPEPHTHVIEPHTLVIAGPRWHVRAFSTPRGEFRDFGLGRILQCTPLAIAATRDVKADAAWYATVRVRLVAHPALDREQQEVVRHEYFGDTAARVETCRGALVPYLIQELRVAVDTTAQAPPDYILAVENVKEVKPWIFP